MRQNNGIFLHPMVQILGQVQAYSRAFNVNLWTGDHVRLDEYVDELFERYFFSRKAESRKRTIKIVLLNLYQAWCDDPTLLIAFAQNPNFYRPKSLYNEAGLSKLVVGIVHGLIENGLIVRHQGFFDHVRGIGRRSRIWASEALLEIFSDLGLSPLDIYPYGQQWSVVLRETDEDAESQDIEYAPTPATDQMAGLLGRYNTLLRHTFIDIPTLEEPCLIDGNGRVIFSLGNDRKYVRRIFNRGSLDFDCGGRFYGGWWQSCPKELRSQIFINDHPTNEVDFSGLHIVMLYARKGISYWGLVGTDPYLVPPIEWLGSPEEQRKAVKGLLLMLLNAETPDKAYAAFRQSQPTGHRLKRLTNEQLGEVHHALSERHPHIAEFFGADVGISLMNEDAKITEILITRFVDRTLPILSIHDSYIVPCGYEDFLIEEMANAFQEVMNVPLPTTDQTLTETSPRTEVLWNMLMSWVPYEGYVHPEETEYRERINPVRTSRYLQNLKQYKLFSSSRSSGR
ncbi:hypothetical protein [Terasakiella pusilla]|uniref:hypothetical protein n=1 Tax=Terasakiella pusilla TaxID=64973 RepID=UPI003AA96AC3